MGRISGFIVSLSRYFAHEQGFILILKHKENRFLSICRNIKSQDDFLLQNWQAIDPNA